MLLTLDSLTHDVRLSVAGPGGHSPQVIRDIAGSAWIGQLPASQDYLIRVSAGNTDTRFSLGVEVPQRITFESGGVSAHGDVSASCSRGSDHDGDAHLGQQRRWPDYLRLAGWSTAGARGERSDQLDRKTAGHTRLRDQSGAERGQCQLHTPGHGQVATAQTSWSKLQLGVCILTLRLRFVPLRPRPEPAEGMWRAVEGCVEGRASCCPRLFYACAAISCLIRGRTSCGCSNWLLYSSA